MSNDLGYGVQTITVHSSVFWGVFILTALLERLLKKYTTNATQLQKSHVSCEAIRTLGWVDIGTVAQVPLRVVVYLTKVGKMANFFDRFSGGHNFLNHTLQGHGAIFSQSGPYGNQKTLNLC
jgi:hypothetical protein